MQLNLVNIFFLTAVFGVGCLLGSSWVESTSAVEISPEAEWPEESWGEEAPVEPREPLLVSDDEKQKETIRRLRNLSQMFRPWQARQSRQQTGLSLLSEPERYWRGYAQVSIEDLRTWFRTPGTHGPVRQLVRTDGWGHRLEYYVNVDTYEVLVRSPGADDVFESLDALRAGFPATEYDRDIVIANGYFEQWPVPSR
ncbi:MAG: hypothetical protein AAGD06_23640 [Acidobacteriota bacterium]